MSRNRVHALVTIAQNATTITLPCNLKVNSCKILLSDIPSYVVHTQRDLFNSVILSLKFAILGLSSRLKIQYSAPPGTRPLPCFARWQLCCFRNNSSYLNFCNYISSCSQSFARVIIYDIKSDSPKLIHGTCIFRSYTQASLVYNRNTVLYTNQ
jgi:hypothetical protein